MPGIKGIGKLDRRIIIQQEVVEVNAFNETEVMGWDEVCRMWVRVDDDDKASNKEYFDSDQITARRTLLFTGRYRTGLSEKMRVLYNGRYYGIVSINEPDRRISTVIKAVLLDET